MSFINILFNFIMGDKIKYFELIQLLNENSNNRDILEKIKKKYINLLKFLTETEDMSLENFINQINIICNMGKIIVGISGDLHNNFEIVGSGTIILEPKIIHNLRSVGHIEDIVVHPDFRNKGIAKKIIELVKNIAKDDNCYKIILNCKDEYIEIYKKLGFEKKNNEMSFYF